MNSRVVRVEADISLTDAGDFLPVVVEIQRSDRDEVRVDLRLPDYASVDDPVLFLRTTEVARLAAALEAFLPEVEHL